MRKIDRHSLASFGLGALTVAAFAPFGFYPLVFLTSALLFWQWLLLSPGRAALSGYFYGLGLMLFGVFWLHVSISQFGGVSLPLAMLLAVIFAFVMALYYAAAAYLATWLACRFRAGRSLSLLMIFPAVWVLFELLRGYLLGGFPWLVLGYSQADSPFAQVAPVAGVYAVSWLVLLVSGALVLLLRGIRMARVFAGLVLVVVAVALFRLSTVQWSQPAGDWLSARLVQANIEQAGKWQPANLLPTLDLYTRLSFEQPAELVVWPETAVPAFYHRVEDSFIRMLQDKLQQRNASMVLGIPFWEDDDGRYYNSMISLGVSSDRYDKRHLVPFGEFMPLDSLLRPLLDFMHIPMSNFAAGQAASPLMKAGNYLAGVSICYEDAFGNETIQALPDAHFLINISNDAWFGDSLAPHQHLQIARMRAIETARFQLRATNTGLSAFIDDKGKLLVASELNQQSVLSGKIMPLQGATPYVQVGDWLVIAGTLSLLLLLPVASAVRRAKQ